MCDFGGRAGVQLGADNINTAAQRASQRRVVSRLQNCTSNAKFLLQLILLELVLLWRGLNSRADFGPENEKFKPSKTDELFFAPSGTEFNVHVLSLCSKQFKNGFLLILHYVFALKLKNQA